MSPLTAADIAGLSNDTLLTARRIVGWTAIRHARKSVAMLDVFERAD
jgi:hypothetical protein